MGFRKTINYLIYGDRAGLPGRFSVVLTILICGLLRRTGGTVLGVNRQHRPRPLKLERFPKPAIPKENIPSIAIVVPSFMQGEFLDSALSSIRDQGYPKLNCIVQDGGSTDESLNVIREHEKWLSGWESASDGGQAKGIMKGLKKSDAEIMAWLNSDDMLMPGALRFAGEYFAVHPGVDVIYGHRVVVDESGMEIGRWVLPPHDAEMLRWVDFVPQETVFWRRRIWEKVGGLDCGFDFALDWDLLLRFQEAGARIVRTPYFLGCFRSHPRQKSQVMSESVGRIEMTRIRQKLHGASPLQSGIVRWQWEARLRSAWFAQLMSIGIRK